MSLDEDFATLLARLNADEDEELDDPDLGDPDLDDADGAPAAHITTCEEQADDAEYLARGGQSPYRNRTSSYRDYHKARPGSLSACVLVLLAYMRSLKLDLPLLLWALSYNVPELVTNELAKFERTALLSSAELISLLRTWHKPPRGHSRGVRSRGAAATIDAFVLETVVSVTRKEMVAVGTYMRTKPSDLSSDTLLSIKISDMRRDVEARAPTLSSILRSCSWSSRQEKENTSKDPDTAVLYMISMASFMRSNRNNALQRLTAIYLKSCGTSAKAFDTLSAVGITMSPAWTYRAIEQLSESEHQAMHADLGVYPWFGSHDNVNFKFRVFEQRSDHHSHFDSGTVGTIYVVKDPDAVAPSGQILRDHRLLNRSCPLLSASQVFALEAAAAPRLAIRAADTLLQTLLATPGFALDSYEHRNHPLLKPAARPGQLRAESGTQVRQYVLDTVHMEEASYDGNDRVMHEWLRQLKLDSVDEQKRTGTDRVIPWVGDQLTASRLRGLLHFRRDDFNSFERLDWLIPNFGWFHLMFAFEQSLHTQYYGTRTGLGLVHAFEVLGRRGLHTTSTQGTFHHTFEEALDHTFQAHVRALWCSVGEVEDVKELRSRTPEELSELATRIRDDHASTHSLMRLETTASGMPQKSLDPLHRQTMQFIRDVLDYIILRDAISCGDIQTMEDMLPRLLFRFSGGQNSNYAIEVCELMQNLNSDWPEDLKTFIRKYCWVTNPSGHKNSAIPIDRAQEHNVGQIKHTFAAMGPFSTWEYLGKTSASIPAQRRVKDHVEREVNHRYRGKSHTRPQEETDIAELQAAYQNARIYKPLSSRRKLESQDRFTDVMKTGSEAVASGKAFKGWAKNRLAVQRVTEEIWDEKDMPDAGSGS